MIYNYVHFNSINDGIVDYPEYEDDEVTSEMAMCPPHCECMGHAAFCTRGNLSNFALDLSYVGYSFAATYLQWHLPPAPLSTFFALKYLDLANNELQGLFSFIFSPLHSLIALILRNISISEI